MTTSLVQSLAGRAASAIEQVLISPSANTIASRYAAEHTRSNVSTPAVPAVLMRAGTSRGVFLHSRHLPKSKDTWPGIISSIMGSHNGDSRQLDGVGGATSTTSKAAIISPPSRPDADVDYTFAQVGVGENKVNMSGSCGNICSGVGPFALEERLVKPSGRGKVASHTPSIVAHSLINAQAVVRVHDTNTGAIIEQILVLDQYGRYKADGDHRISGFSGTGSPLKMSWLKPAGTSGPRKFYPTGNATDIITVKVTDIPSEISAEVSLIDAANPFVFVDATSLPQEILKMGHADPKVLSMIEAIRCEAAVHMGIASTAQEAHTNRPIPKIALLYPPEQHQQRADIRVAPYSMGKPHPSCQLTGTIALSAALSYPGTVASKLAQEARGLPQLDGVQVGGVHKTIAHPSGFNQAEVYNTLGKDNTVELDKVSVLTTAQRIFKGEAYVQSLL